MTIPVHADGSATLYMGDCRSVMSELPDNSVHSIVTDPPYEIGMHGVSGVSGTRWDSTGVAFDPAVWREALRVLKPGGHILVCSATRTSHRVATVLEQVGFEIRDSVGWIYGSGMPRGQGMHVAIRRGHPEAPRDAGVGWSTALKPALELVIVARKPCGGSAVDAHLAHGTGGLHVDACRVGDEVRHAVVKPKPACSTARAYTGSEYEMTYVGRYPSNVIVDDHISELLPEHARPFFYCAKAPKSERPVHIRADGTEVRHPTVKPIKLMQYLVRLVTPPGGEVLDPFAGSGATVEAALLEGFSVIGIELEPDHIPLIQQRIERATEGKAA